MKADMLKCTHEGHIWIEKSRARAMEVIYWQRMNAEIEDYILIVVSVYNISIVNRKSLL